ncbi:MAG TPA: acyl-CoA desaturase, partial [Lacipirellulaceae bacterium]
MSRSKATSPRESRFGLTANDPPVTSSLATESNGNGCTSGAIGYVAANGSADVSTDSASEATAAGASQLLHRGIDWPVVVWIGLVHVLALVAPFYFSWQALIACAVLIVLTGAMGVCMGYHRCLTHGAFKTYRPVRWLLAFLGGLSGEGSVLTWVANHRKHHYFSDKEGDPHSPRDGRLWSHMLWFMPNFGRRWHRELAEKYAPDLLKDKMMLVIHHLFLPSHLATGVVLFLIGYFATGIGLGGWRAGLSMVFWGLGVRMVYVLHVTWMINSVTHMWGYRRYETSDDSRNLWWVGLLAF